MIENINVRFFVYQFDDSQNDYDLMEVAENEFLEFDGQVAYERNTVFANGCRQITLTKGLD